MFTTRVRQPEVVLVGRARVRPTGNLVQSEVEINVDSYGARWSPGGAAVLVRDADAVAVDESVGGMDLGDYLRTRRLTDGLRLPAEVLEVRARDAERVGIRGAEHLPASGLAIGDARPGCVIGGHLHSAVVRAAMMLVLVVVLLVMLGLVVLRSRVCNGESGRGLSAGDG
jgi:hypothetical protein